MDLVKRGRNKLQEGDCVSLPTSYWGSVYARLSEVERLYGRVKGNWPIQQNYCGVGHWWCIDPGIVIEYVWDESRTTRHTNADSVRATTSTTTRATSKAKAGFISIFWDKNLWFPPRQNREYPIPPQNLFLPRHLKKWVPPPRQSPKQNPDFSPKFWGEMTLCLLCSCLVGRSIFSCLLVFFLFCHDSESPWEIK